jgi:hypothetical protein
VEPIKVLYIGDSEVVLNRYLVGAFVIEQTYFNDNGRWFREAMANEQLLPGRPRSLPVAVYEARRTIRLSGGRSFTGWRNAHRELANP